mmetsp:Transcript_26329/g.66410  ORF Transcript_26329/g.66410 Transcript_26329/m.66410 type:complete len:269 (-) Transcript_26329:772-1578(-)
MGVAMHTAAELVELRRRRVHRGSVAHRRGRRTRLRGRVNRFSFRHEVVVAGGGGHRRRDAGGHEGGLVRRGALALDRQNSRLSAFAGVAVPQSHGRILHLLALRRLRVLVNGHGLAHVDLRLQVLRLHRRLPGNGGAGHQRVHKTAVAEVALHRGRAMVRGRRRARGSHHGLVGRLAHDLRGSQHALGSTRDRNRLLHGAGRRLGTDERVIFRPIPRRMLGDVYQPALLQDIRVPRFLDEGEPQQPALFLSPVRDHLQHLVDSALAFV